MKNIIIIFKKQIKDTIKNKTILIQFILFPIITLIMENAIQMEGMPEHFFAKLFSIMYIGMAPLTSTAAIISEEKEKNTLRVLLMTNVQPWQYLLGVGIYVWSICMIGASVIATGFRGNDIVTHLIVMAVGFMISILIGACIGIYAKNQMGATSLVMPIMMVLSFLPMLAMFNEKIEKVARFLFTQQLKLCLNDMSVMEMSKETYIVLFVNVIITIVIFGLTFKKKGLE